MASAALHTAITPANPIVQAYLATRANLRQIDDSDQPSDSFEARMAMFSERGAHDYAMAWSISDPRHGALVAILAAERLTNIFEIMVRTDGEGRKYIAVGAEELNEVHQIKHALLNLWRFLDTKPASLFPLAEDMGLIDERGNQIG